MSLYIALICGLNIRALNRITLDDQLVLLNSAPNEMSVTAVEDKGSYLVRTDLGPAEVVAKILDVLRSRCPAIKGAGAVAPSVVKNALYELTSKLQRQYDGIFRPAILALPSLMGSGVLGLPFLYFLRLSPILSCRTIGQKTQCSLVSRKGRLLWQSER
jgi:hypothetical protein